MALPIESLRRGLRVLNALADTQYPPATLHALHVRTDIPKPSLLSILETLRQEEVAEEAEGIWRLRQDWLNRAILCSTHRLQRQAEKRSA